MYFSPVHNTLKGHEGYHKGLPNKARLSPICDGFAFPMHSLIRGLSYFLNNDNSLIYESSA